MITTKFSGFAKVFRLSYEKEPTQLKNIVIRFKVQDLDTDSDARNEKMYQQCLDSKTYPEIIAKVDGVFKLEEGEKEVPILLTIKDKTLSRPFKIKVTKDGQKWWVSGQGDFNFKDFNIADPSIMIAKVRERFDLEFKLLLENI